MANDIAGQTFNQARTVRLGATPVRFSDRVGLSDLGDIFRFSLARHSRFSLSLTNTSGQVDAALIHDRNNNGRADQGEILTNTNRLNGTTKTITSSGLVAGTYFVQLTARARAASSYNLSLAAPAPTASTPTPTPSIPSPTPAPAPGTTQPPVNSFVARVFDLTNTIRQRNGLPLLRYSTRLGQAAQTHSQNMALQDFFSHTGKDGSSAQNRGITAGYSGGVGENIAAGYATPEAVVNGWMNSPGHRANILNAQYRDIGIGYFNLANDTGNVNFGSYWTQAFGIPR